MILLDYSLTPATITLEYAPRFDMANHESRRSPSSGDQGSRLIIAESKTGIYAGIAQLVEHDLAKVGVASSNLVSRSNSLPC